MSHISNQTTKLKKAVITHHSIRMITKRMRTFASRLRKTLGVQDSSSGSTGVKTVLRTDLHASFASSSRGPCMLRDEPCDRPEFIGPFGDGGVAGELRMVGKKCTFDIPGVDFVPVELSEDKRGCDDEDAFDIPAVDFAPVEVKDKRGCDGEDACDVSGVDFVPVEIS
mmetsp:Transcript_7089/g.11483  ORF Transcript_7089/g.11483 Transcript_7089/m.11483 type:complete len:168 (+) Transcript_7089:562-1065(+)